MKLHKIVNILSILMFLTCQIFLACQVLAEPATVKLKPGNVTVDADKINISFAGGLEIKKEFYLQKPLRLVFDLSPATITPSKNTISGSGIVENISVAQYNNNPPIVRMVLKLTKKLSYKVDAKTGRISIAFAEAIAPEKSTSTAAQKPEAPKTSAQVKPEETKAPETPKQEETKAPETAKAEEAVAPEIAKAEVAKAEEAKTPEQVKPEETKVPEIAPKEEAPKAEASNAEETKAPEMSTPEEAKASETPVTEGLKAPETAKPEEMKVPEPQKSEEQKPEVQAAKVKEPPATGLNKKITINVQEEDLLNFLRVLAEEAGYNVVFSRSVSGKISMRLKDVTIEQALTIVLNLNNLNFAITGNIIKIATPEEIVADTEKAPPITQFFTLNYAKVENVQASLRGMLSSRGKIDMDSRTNSLMITDTPNKLREISSIIAKLDSKVPQVLIESRLEEISEDVSDRLGINWTIAKGLPGASTATPTAAKAVSPEYEAKLNVSPQAGSGAAAQMQFGTIVSNFNITAILEALATEGKADTIANPKIVTSNNQMATIDITKSIPYVAGYDQNTGVTTYSTITVGIKLTVTPQINTEGYITMDVTPTVSSMTGTTPSGLPMTSTRTVTTKVRVKNGETLVIGGLLQDQETITTSKVPLLGDFPFIGFLFKSKLKSKGKLDLVIFVTPHILE